MIVARLQGEDLGVPRMRWVRSRCRSVLLQCLLSCNGPYLKTMQEKIIMPSLVKARRWRYVLGAALVVGVLPVLGFAFLFSGSEVVCSETAGSEEPRLGCTFKVAASPQEVWDALVRTGEPRPFYFDAVLEAEMFPGGRWRFVTDDRERLLAGGRILALEPPSRLVQTFRAADLDDPPSRITVELEPLGDDCRVTLVHDRFPRPTRTYKRFRRAHPLALSALKSLLENGELPLRTRIYTAIFKPGMKLFTVWAEPWSEK